LRDEPASEHFWRHSGSLSALRCSTVATSRPASSSPTRDCPAQTTQQLGTRYDTSGIPGGGLGCVALGWVGGLHFGRGGGGGGGVKFVESRKTAFCCHFTSPSASRSLIRSLGHGQPPLPARGGMEDYRTRLLLARFTGFWTRKGAGSVCIAQSGCIGLQHTPSPGRHVTPATLSTFV
jgi:hypothetical protein